MTNHQYASKRYKAYFYVTCAAAFVLMAECLTVFAIVKKQELHLGQDTQILMYLLPILTSGPLLSIGFAYRKIRKSVPTALEDYAGVLLEVRHSLTAALASVYGTIMVILITLLGLHLTAGR
ncbi:MAG: hypothetical protein WA647_03750 [Candidatus Acidiferrum sp.]